jgi:hypothetical protein
VLLLGTGLFPGLSNILARESVRLLPSATRVTAAVRIHVLSGAGRAMIELMHKYMANRERAGGSIDLRDPVTRVRFSSGMHAALALDMPEAVMLRTRLPAVVVEPRIAFSPAPVTFGVAKWREYMSPSMTKTIEPVTSAALRLVRATALRRRDAAAEISGIAASSTDTVALMARVPHAIEAGAWIVSATVHRLMQRPAEPGFYLPDDLFRPSELAATLREISSPVEIVVSRQG